jgi:IS605 OrfB family transposase
MITVKLPYVTDQPEIIQEYQKRYSPVIRSAYNLSIDLSRTEKRHVLKSRFPGNDAWFQECALLEGISMRESDSEKEKCRIFGGRKLFSDRISNKITKEEWRIARLLPLSIVGEANQKGNRKVKLDIQNKVIWLKFDRQTHVKLQLPNLNKNYRNQLLGLEDATSNKLMPFSVKINSRYIYISYDEILLNSVSNKAVYIPVKDRYLSLDMNPNYIGVAVVENTAIITTELIDLSKLTVTSGKSSDHEKSKYLNNKLEYETSIIAKHIADLAKFYKCEHLFLEELKFKQGDKGKGKNFNRITSNSWKRNLFTRLVNKHCGITGIKVKQINAAYTSFIGNCQYEYPDPINAALEVGRRGIDWINKKPDSFYPAVVVKQSLANLWKKDPMTQTFDNIDNWKDLFALIKKSKFRYRSPVPDSGFRTLAHKKSYVYIINI